MFISITVSHPKHQAFWTSDINENELLGSRCGLFIPDTVAQGSRSVFVGEGLIAFILHFCVPGASLSALLGAVTRYPSPVLSGLRHETGVAFNAIEEEPAAAAEASTGRCLETVDPWTPCLCHLEMCIGWYPCGLKYCKGKSDAKVGSVGGSYRCGIKTCKKCSLFSYYVRQKQLCLWDEWPRAHSWRKRVPWQWFSSRCLCV